MPAHLWETTVGGHSFVPFWHKNTPGGCSVFYAVYSVVISIVLSLFWPVVQTGINNFGIWIANSSETFPILAPFIYGTLERLLLPFGLHHMLTIPMQDWLGLDNAARINKPSTVGQNWRWRLKKTQLTKKLQKEICQLTTRYGRKNWA